MKRVVVITGGSSGLGKELAILFSKNDDYVVISGRNKKGINKAAKETNSIPFVSDVRKERNIKSLRDYTVKNFGKIDIWINNAGIWIPHNFFERVNTKDIRDLFETNIYGVIYGCKYAVEQMKKQGYGHIVNISSTSGLEGRSKSAIYCSSKFAVRGFSNSIYFELKDFGINVTTVYPGGMKTKLFRKEKPKEYDVYMDPKKVAEKIFNVSKKNNPPENLIIRRKR